MKRKLTKAQFKAKEERLEQKKLMDEKQQKLQMDVDTIPKISQSLLKALFKYRQNEMCGLVLEHQYIKGKSLPSTEAQELGNYFEFICTGALPRDKHIPEEKLLKSGKPAISYDRMNKQRDNFDRIMQHYGFEIEKIGHSFTNPKYSGVADIIAFDTNIKSKDKYKKRVIIDLKTSGLLNDKWSEYGWHNDSIEEKWNLNIQAIQYKILAKFEWGIEDIPFYFMVFSNKNAEEVKMFEIIVDDATRYQHIQNLEKAKVYLDEQLKNGLKPKPELTRCLNCGLKETCLHRTDVPNIQKVYI
tara:strand:- start:5276 stop:6175 length:900 start_codon:yes stop_codon:yes gene_type:complete